MASQRAPTSRRCQRHRPTTRKFFASQRAETRTELPDLNAPEFEPIRARLARAYLDHKADIGAPHATDQDILDHVDDITALMLGALGRAMTERRHAWLQHYGWFTDLVIELLDDEPGKPLDG